MNFNLRHFFFLMIFFASVVGRGSNPHGPRVVRASEIEAPVVEEEGGTGFEECCYGKDGKVPQLEAALKDPNLPQEVKTELTTALELAKSGEGNPAIMKWFHDISQGVFSEEDGKRVVNLTSLSEWTSSPPPSPTNGIITTPTVTPPVLPQPTLPGPGAPPVATAPTPNPTQAPTPLNPQTSELAQNPHTDRPFLFPERDPLSALKPQPIKPLPQMSWRPGQPENLEGRLVWAPKPTPARPMAINIPALPTIAQRPDSILPEVFRPETFRVTSPPAPPAPVSSSPVPPPKPLAPNQALAQPQPAPAAAAPAQPAPADPLAAAAEAAPSVVVISKAAAPQQSAFSQNNLESEKLSLEKNSLKSDEGASSLAPLASVVPNQNSQQAASLPALESGSAYEGKALSANKKASRFLPDFSSAFGRLKEILHAKKTGTASATTQLVLSQNKKLKSEKDYWAVERSPASWESNAGGLEAADKGRSSIHFSSFQVGAGMATALGALIAILGWFFYKRQMQNRKPTWVEFIIDNPSLRKRPTKKVKPLSRSPK